MKRKEYLKLMAEYMQAKRINTQGQAEVIGEEFEYWLKASNSANGRIMEIGCGTGYYLIPLLKNGCDIVGLDNSEHMLERCRMRCDHLGLKPELHCQSMQDFQLKCEYGLIFMGTGNLSLLLADEDLDRTFSTIYQHLLHDGQFKLEFEQVTTMKWVKENQNKWIGNWFKAEDDVIYDYREMYRVTNEAQSIWESLLIIEKYSGCQLIEKEANLRCGRSFYPSEVKDRLERAGFRNVTLTNRINDTFVSPEEGTLLFTCSK